MSPPASPVAQRVSATQETAKRSRGVGEPAARQAEASPPGSFETKIRPSLATATQSEGVAQETPRRSGDPASWALFQMPEVGSVEVKTRPADSPYPPDTATQRDADGHDTAVRCEAPGPSFTSFTDQAPAPPVGLVEVKTEPSYPTATQRLSLGQETAWSDPRGESQNPGA